MAGWKQVWIKSAAAWTLRHLQQQEGTTQGAEDQDYLVYGPVFIKSLGGNSQLF